MGEGQHLVSGSTGEFSLGWEIFQFGRYFAHKWGVKRLLNLYQQQVFQSLGFRSHAITWEGCVVAIRVGIRGSS